MGYFSNGSEGECYQEGYCKKCKNWVDKKDGAGFGCAIWDLHMMHSYELCNSKSKAKKILDFLIPTKDCGNGECRMFLNKQMQTSFNTNNNQQEVQPQSDKSISPNESCGEGSSRQLINSLRGCGKMYCGICGKIDDSHTAYCLKDGKCVHRICGENGLCPNCSIAEVKE